MKDLMELKYHGIISLVGGNVMPVYHCKKCLFNFKREGEVKVCPDCGKPDIRLATQKEIKEFEQDQKGEKKE